jgi:hypothetical protein
MILEGIPRYILPAHSTHPHISQSYVPQKQTEIQKQKISCPLEKLYQLLEKQEQLFVTWLQELSQTISKVRETYYTRVSLLDEMIEELEAKQDQPEWDLMQVSVSVPSLCLPSVSNGMTWALEIPPPSQEAWPLRPGMGLGLSDPQCLFDEISQEPRTS